VLSGIGPGLYFLGLVLALGAVLRKWYDPVPSRLLALFALLPFLLFGRALIGGEVLLPLANLRQAIPYRQLPPTDRPAVGLQGDLVRQIAPWQLEVRRALADGRWPLWNANAGAGMPLMGDPQSQSFQPLIVAGYPFDVWAGVGITGALRVFLALIFLFLFLRRLGLGEPPAALGALAFGLGGFLLLWLGWPVANSAALLPLGLYAVARADGPGGRRDTFLLYLAGLGLFLGGHPETVLYALAMIGLLLLVRAWSRPRLLVRGAAALVLAGLTAAPVLLPAREYLPASQRSVLLSIQLAPRPVSDLWADLWKPETLAFWRDHAERRLLPVAVPRVYGDHSVYRGDTNVIEDAGGFAGTLTLLLALSAMVPGARRRFPQERLAMGVLVACLLLIAQPPGFENLAFRLPGIGPTAIHRHHRTLMLVALTASWLAACEVERWRLGESRRAVHAALAAVLAGLVAWGYLAQPHQEPGSWMAVQLAALGLGLALLFLRVRPAAWLLTAVVAGELLLFHLPANPTGPRRLAWPVTPPLRFLLDHAGADRMVGLGAAVLPANFPLVYGLADVRIDNPSLPDRYAQVVAPISRPSLTPNFHRPEQPVYALLGARYVLTRSGAVLPEPLRLVFRDPSGWVWERPDALPRLFLPMRGQIFTGGDWRVWLGGNPNFAVRALVQSTADRDRNWRARAPRTSTIGIVALEPAHLRARVVLKERRLLASSVFQDGNWHLLDRREKQPVILVNGPFIGAWLQAGEREIDLIYRPRSFVIGCLLAALSLAIAAAWWVRPPSIAPVLSSNHERDPRTGGGPGRGGTLLAVVWARGSLSDRPHRGLHARQTGLEDARPAGRIDVRQPGRRGVRGDGLRGCPSPALQWQSAVRDQAVLSNRGCCEG
jgi:hypothetical protein